MYPYVRGGKLSFFRFHSFFYYFLFYISTPSLPVEIGKNCASISIFAEADNFVRGDDGDISFVAILDSNSHFA